MEAAYLYNNMERFLRHNGNRQIEEFYSLNKGLLTFNTLLQRALKFKKKYLSEKLVGFMDSQDIFKREFNALEVFIERLERTIGEFEVVGEEAEGLNGISITSKLSGIPCKEEKRMVVKPPRRSHENDFLMDNHLPYYKDYLNRELGKEFIDYSMDFFLEYCFYRMKNGVDFVNRLGEFGGRRKGHLNCTQQFI